MVAKTCFSWLKMMIYWINTMKLGTRLKYILNIKFHSIPVYDENTWKPK